MTFEEYLKYIIEKFNKELNQKWIVEAITIFNEPGLHITDRYWHFRTGILVDLYNGNIPVETAYQGIKKILEQEYLKQLWR